jgi:serine/threonine protein kinase
MECGEKTLTKYLSVGSPLEETNAVDIMLQIAKGMCYLHDMKVAHRDLKPGNVVVTLPNDSTLSKLGCIQVKLLDFGISKVEVKDYGEVPTGQYIGTCGYMAPEVMANELSEVDALKADVFSFGMLCSDILSAKKRPFGSFREYQKYILEDSRRPKLPKSYSEGLRSIVHDCWSLDPLERPTFLDIQYKLTSLKRLSILKGVVTMGGATNDTHGSLWKVFLSYLCFVLVSWIRYFWFVFKFKHVNRPTLFPSTGKVSNGSSPNPFSMKVSMWLSL